ncbi:MAG TPA: helix-turn-helix transcriptional regulator [Dehalococcoidia bacterium]|nr:helix-turn-helix transcriptional regulator [Dehalococcoidia bacterium]
MLTPREWEVLGLLREGLSNEEITERLGITLRTAKFHVSEILSKLGVGTREQAAAWSREERVSARRWLAWPVAARLTGSLVIVAALAGLGLLTWGVLRTSDGSEADAANVLRRAVQKMDESTSYRTEMDVDGDGAADYIAEVVSPGSYHVWQRTDYAPADATNPWREYIYSSSGYYTRACDDFPECEGWIEIRDLGPQGPLTTAEISRPLHGWNSQALELGSSFFVPRFGLEALRIAVDSRLEAGEGAGRLAATTRVYQAELSGIIALFDSLGLSRWVEAFEREAGRWDRQNVQGSLDVWLSPIGTPSRVRISFQNPYVYPTPLPTTGPYMIPIQSAPPVAQTLDITFSRLNEVTITPPADFIPLPTPTPNP